MQAVIRSLICAILVLFSGDAIGLTIYYLAHLDKWATINASKIILLIIISLIMAAAHAVFHEAPTGNPRAQARMYVMEFLLGILTALMVTFKPL